jgi:hypothetical protein
MNIEDKSWVNVINDVEDDDVLSEQEIDRLIDLQEKEIKTCYIDIKKAQESIINLEFRKKKLKYGENSIVFEVADRLHNKLCMSCYTEPSHCTYNMTSWDDFFSEDSRSWMRQDYVEKAKGFIERAKQNDISLRKALRLFDEI